MNNSTIFVEEYLSTLKEDKELDYLFPMLLSLMGFRIVQTARESKGQNQYGKDIIAIGKDQNGEFHRWYFELKGYKDKDITDSNYSTRDGIRESIIEAKDTAFNDSSITEFNNLPIKIVLVHNGIVKANIKPTLDGFVNREFEEGEFERWDIYHLTNLFSKYLLNEYLLLDTESNTLFKKTLAFIDIPDYDYKDFKALVRLQMEKVTSVKGRAFKKLFATLSLLETLIFHYSRESGNLISALECSKYLVLETWHWILFHKYEGRKAVLKQYDKLLSIQLDIFNAYLKKTFPIARILDGLFAENGVFFEKIGYPLRCFEYLDNVIYFSRLRLYNPKLSGTSKYSVKLHDKQKDLIIELITNNSGFYRPIIDNHSIPIIQLFLFFTNEGSMRQKDVDFITDYIFKTIHNVLLEKLKYDRLPELSNNLDVVIESVATGAKPGSYCDSSSVLIAILLELTVVFDAEIMFKEILRYIPPELSLQIPSIDFEEHEAELLLFEKHLHNEYYVECIERIPDESKRWTEELNFKKFKKFVAEKKSPLPKYRTDLSGMSFLRYLAHSYYKNEILPNEWRNAIGEEDGL